jgi:hypothetical protein
LRKLEEEQNTNMALRRRANEALSSREQIEAAKSKIEAESAQLRAQLESVNTLLKAEKEKFLEQASQMMVLEQRTFECEADAVVNDPAYNLHLSVCRGPADLYAATYIWSTSSRFNRVALHSRPYSQKCSILRELKKPCPAGCRISRDETGRFCGGGHRTPRAKAGYDYHDPVRF